MRRCVPLCRRHLRPLHSGRNGILATKGRFVVTPGPSATLRAACEQLKFAPLPALALLDGLHQQGTTDIQWYPVRRMVEEGHLPVLFDKLRTEHGPEHRLPAATNFLRVTLREPIFLASASLYLTGRAPLLSPDNLYLPWHTTETRFGTPTVVDLRWVVLPDDPAKDRPDTVVARDEADQYRRAGEAVFAAFAPLLDALHAHSRAGKRTLWGWVLDTLHFYMLNPARFLGRDAEAAWESATLLGDEVLSAGAITRKRPRLFPFAPENPRGTWAVRGTCCFEYKSDVEHGYCTTCPLKCDSERRDDLAEWLRDPSLAP